MLLQAGAFPVPMLQSLVTAKKLILSGEEQMNSW